MARRNGLQIARGKYIVHVDSDDVCSENLLITLYRTIIKEEADLIIYNFELIDEDNRLIEEKTPKSIQYGLNAQKEALWIFQLIIPNIDD